MTVQEAKDITREWLLARAASLPDLQGAFFHGSITWLSDEDDMPPGADVDLIVILNHPDAHRSGKLSHGGLILDVTYLPREEPGPAEQVLSKFFWAGSFRRPNIIADRTGQLTALQKEVALKFAHRHWVIRRCEDARDRAIGYIGECDPQAPLHDQVTHWLFGRGLMVHMLLVAGLKNPTVRKRYVEVRKLLAAHTPPAPPDFYERLLESVHFAQLDAPTVGRWLHALEPAFDAARDCIRSPYRFAADISDTGRPIAIDQSWHLVRAGLHREAMFWILATWCRCMHILTADASPAILERQTGEFQQLLTSLGITSFQQRQESNRVAADFLKEVWTVCEDIIARL